MNTSNEESMTQTNDSEWLKSDSREHLAALDLGSNSFHLIIGRVIEGQIQPIHKFKQRVSLAEGLLSKGISVEAFERGLDALSQFAMHLRDFAPERVRVVATHTLREANNRKEFIQAARQLLPFPIEVISGREEARLIYLGVAQAVPFRGPRLIIDIGGGSTEFAVGKDEVPELLLSKSFGSLVVSERFFAKGKITEKRFNKAVLSVKQELEPFSKQLKRARAEQVLGTSGTIKALAKWIHPNTEGDLSIELQQLHQLRDKLLALKDFAQIDPAEVEPARIPSIVGGLAVLIAVCEELNIDRLNSVDAALREGVLFELAEQAVFHKDIRYKTIQSMAVRYQVDDAQAERVLASVERVLEGVGKAWKLNTPDIKLLLTGASGLHEVGMNISSSGIQKHSGYILSNAYMPGFSSDEQRVLALLCRYFRKKISAEDLSDFAQFDHLTVARMIVVIRLGVLLNASRQTHDALRSVSLKGSTLMLKLQGPLANSAILAADIERENKHLSVLGYQLVIA